MKLAKFIETKKYNNSFGSLKIIFRNCFYANIFINTAKLMCSIQIFFRLFLFVHIKHKSSISIWKNVFKALEALKMFGIWQILGKPLST